jgi:hypothetical protein
MKYLQILWQRRLFIIIAAIAGLIWYADHEAKQRRAEEERKIAAQIDDKKRREEDLFAQY